MGNNVSFNPQSFSSASLCTFRSEEEASESGQVSSASSAECRAETAMTVQTVDRVLDEVRDYNAGNFTLKSWQLARL